MTSRKFGPTSPLKSRFITKASEIQYCRHKTLVPPKAVAYFKVAKQSICHAFTMKQIKFYLRNTSTFFKLFHLLFFILPFRIVITLRNR